MNLEKGNMISERQNASMVPKKLDLVSLPPRLHRRANSLLAFRVKVMAITP